MKEKRIFWNVMVTETDDMRLNEIIKTGKALSKAEVIRAAVREKIQKIQEIPHTN